METGGYTYIVTNRTRTTLYIGSTTNLVRRIHEHKSRNKKTSFTNTYKTFYLVYYEGFSSIKEARYREYNLKQWKRQWKLDLINKNNPNWHDLYDDVLKYNLN